MSQALEPRSVFSYMAEGTLQRDRMKNVDVGRDSRIPRVGPSVETKIFNSGEGGNGVRVMRHDEDSTHCRGL